MKKLLIWGDGDQALVTYDCAIAMKVYSSINFLAFEEKKEHRDIYGNTYEQEINLDKILNNYDEVIVATGNNQLRETKNLLLLEKSAKLATILHPSAIISPFAKVEAGSTVLANAVINANASVGKGCIVNTASVIEHDCEIKDYVNICPRVAMAGHVKIGSHSFLGVGCSIIDQITIGKDVVIGAGATVIKDIPAYAIAVGVPAVIRRFTK